MSELRPRLHSVAVPRPHLRIVEPTVDDGVDAASSGVAWARRYRDRLRLSDTLIVIAAFAIAHGVRLVAEILAGTAPGPLFSYLGVPALVAALWLVCLSAFRTRDPHVIGVGATEYRRIANASALAFGIFAMGCIVFSVDFARGYFLVALPLGMVGLLVGRWSWRRWLLNQRRFGHYLTRALVVGARDDVQYVVDQITRRSGAAYAVVGAAVEESDHSDLVSDGNRVPVVADIEGAATSAARLRADTVIVAGQPSGGGDFIKRLSWLLEGTATDLVLSSRLTDVAGPRIHFRPVEGLPLIHVEIPTFEGWKHTLKRTFDIAFSALALVLLSPLLLAIAIWVRLDSPGRVVFRQERCGRNGESFEMFKFRSMVMTAEDDLKGLLDGNEGSGLLFKMRNDPRVTRAGQWLRKFSLDELLQFWNVFKGDMSIVGPRPPLRAEVERYGDDVHRRLYIKPGITGLWQISGRSDLSWEESVRLDLYYVENWSLTGDFMIIWRTLKTVVSPQGAY
ncbi:sugar transferase [Glaciibacter flavus]|uniref:sugar transferase n=1 Tax=Orlajensenia flava TaxID=2565934 RepID=UPI003B00AE95